MEHTERRLHIGGEARYPGWENFNIQPGLTVDHVGDSLDLSRFEDNTFVAVYASHVLEHFDHATEANTVLSEWFRVLTAGGKVYIGVPDLDALFPMLLDKSFRYRDRYFIMQMIYGGQSHPFDYHKIGWSLEFITHYLTNIGFVNINRVPSFGLFSDTSTLEVLGVQISLNVIADKPG